MFGEELFKAGLISKKDLRKAKQKVKQDRRKEHGTKKKKKVLKAEQKAKNNQARDLQQEQKNSRQKKHQDQQDKRELVNRLQQLIQQNQIVIRNDSLIFWHTSADRKHCHKLFVSERVAKDLRAGKLGITVRGLINDDDPIYVVIPRETVKKILELDPDRILFWNQESPPNLPELQLYHLS
jgi:uncharacterized protein YaiL (DUF2058 family)